MNSPVAIFSGQIPSSTPTGQGRGQAQSTARRGASLAFQNQKPPAGKPTPAPLQLGGGSRSAHVNGALVAAASAASTASAMPQHGLSRQATGGSNQSNPDAAHGAASPIEHGALSRRLSQLHLSQQTTSHLRPPGTRPGTDARSASFIAATLAASRSASPSLSPHHTGQKSTATLRKLRGRAHSNASSVASLQLDHDQENPARTDKASIAPTESLISMFEWGSQVRANTDPKKSPSPVVGWRGGGPPMPVPRRNPDAPSEESPLKDSNPDQASESQPRPGPAQQKSKPKPEPKPKLKPKPEPKPNNNPQPQSNTAPESTYGAWSKPSPGQHLDQAETEVEEPRMTPNPAARSRGMKEPGPDLERSAPKEAMQGLLDPKRLPPLAPYAGNSTPRRQGQQREDEDEALSRSVLRLRLEQAVKPVSARSPLRGLDTTSATAPSATPGSNPSGPPDSARSASSDDTFFSTSSGYGRHPPSPPPARRTKQPRAAIARPRGEAPGLERPSLRPGTTLAAPTTPARAGYMTPRHTPNSSSTVLPLDSLTNAIVAGSLASARHNTPVADSRTPPPIPVPRRKQNVEGQHQYSSTSELGHSPSHQNHQGHAGGQGHSYSYGHSHSRSPPKRSGMLQTLRCPQSKSDDEEARRHRDRHRNRGSLGKRHVHHEGSRRRWREQVSTSERRRYEALWASNRGQFLPGAAGDWVANVVVRDLWSRSRLPFDELAEVWELVDGSRRGMLVKQEFVVGTWLVDQRLRGRKIPTRVSQSVWDSVKGLRVPVPGASSSSSAKH